MVTVAPTVDDKQGDVCETGMIEVNKNNFGMSETVNVHVSKIRFLLPNGERKKEERRNNNVSEAVNILVTKIRFILQRYHVASF